MDVLYAEIQELDPAKKDANYAQKAVTYIRRYWKRYITDLDMFQENKEFLLCKNSIEKVKLQYKDKGFLACTDFRNLGLLTSTIDTLVEELTKDSPKCELQALDPAAMSDRKKDLGLLANRPIIEGDLSAINRQIGMKAGFKFNSPDYKSNIDEFDNMGLDARDPGDVDFFKDFQRLNYEIAGQLLINSILKINRFDEETARKIVLDIVAGRRVALQAYVNKLTGQTTHKYLYPEICYGIFGDSYDGHDDVSRGWQDNISVSEFLQMVGNDFNFDTDWRTLLGAINYRSEHKYTGFERGGTILNCFGNIDWMNEVNANKVGSSDILPWSETFHFKINVGYIEWKTWEATSTNLRSIKNSNLIDIVDYNYDLEKHNQITEYYKDSNFQQQWYSSYYLSSSENTQKIFNFSKVYYQVFEGANDEYSSGTLVFYREPGSSAVESVKGDVMTVHSAYYKMLFMIYKAKPEEDVYQWEEMVQISKLLAPLLKKNKSDKVTNPVEGIIGDIIQYMKENTVRIRAFPQVDGKTIPQLPSLEGKRNGLDPIAVAMQSIVAWGEERIKIKILGNGMRLGMNPPSRESTKSEENSVDASKNSTGYIYRMLQYSKERLATITLSYAQDIINFEDSLPYKYIQNLIGDSAFDGLKVLKDFAVHRYGLFIRDYNTDLARSDLRQAAFTSLQQKEIKWDEYFMISQTDDVKEASRKYALARYKNEKKLRNQQVQDQQMQSQLSQQNFQQQMQIAQFERETIWGGKKIDMQSNVTGKQIDAKGKLDVKDASIQSEPGKQDAKAQAAIDLENTKANLEASKPYET